MVRDLAHRLRLRILAVCDGRVDRIAQAHPLLPSRWDRFRVRFYNRVGVLLDPHHNYPDAHLNHREG